MSLDSKIKLLLVDDHPIVRDGIKARLTAHAHIEIVGEAEGGEEAVRKVQELAPDIVFMDIGLADMNGLEAARILQQKAPDTKVIILTIHDDKEYVLQALRSGAKGYILKNAPSTELVRAVEMVQRGEVFFPVEVSQLILREYARETAASDKSGLSGREQEVLVLIAEGYTNKAIAHELGVSVRTVETHREHIMSKLDLHSVAGLTKYAIAEGLVPLK
jgi:two-component system nitrate/nitrite response regulator NarL